MFATVMGKGQIIKFKVGVTLKNLMGRWYGGHLKTGLEHVIQGRRLGIACHS